MLLQLLAATAVYALQVSDGMPKLEAYSYTLLDQPV